MNNIDPTTMDSTCPKCARSECRRFRLISGNSDADAIEECRKAACPTPRETACAIAAWHVMGYGQDLFEGKLAEKLLVRVRRIVVLGEHEDSPAGRVIEAVAHALAAVVSEAPPVGGICHNCGTDMRRRLRDHCPMCDTVVDVAIQPLVYRCHSCSKVAIGSPPLDWRMFKWRPGVITNTEPRSDRYYCSSCYERPGSFIKLDHAVVAVAIVAAGAPLASADAVSRAQEDLDRRARVADTADGNGGNESHEVRRAL